MIDLNKLYLEYPDCFGDSAKFKAYLIDLYPYERKAIINVLATMLSERVLDTAQKKDGLDEAAFCRRICDDYGFNPDLVKDCFKLFSDIFDSSAAKAASKKSGKRVKRKRSATDPQYPTLDNYDRNKYEIVYGVMESYTGGDSEVKIPQGVTAIFDYAFSDSASITSVIIPDSVTHICDNAFEGCAALIDITLPDSIVHIGWGAFNWCESLKSIVIPKSVTYINNSVFGGCSSLERLEVAPGNAVYHSAGNCVIKTDEKVLVAGCSNSVIPADGSVRAISDGAFAWCEYLKRAVIPYGVTEIGRYAFEYCDSLEHMVIPSSVTDISEEAFCNCKRLTSVTVPASVKKMGNKVFEGCASLTIYCEAKSKPRGWRDGWNPDNRPVVWGYNGKKPAKKSKGKTSKSYPTITNYNDNLFDIQNGVLTHYRGREREAKIPIGVTKIGVYAFCENDFLTSITVPDSVQYIEQNAFCDCTALESITIPKGVQVIESCAFSGCTELKRVLILGNVTTIEDNAFFGCESLKDITLPSSLRLIERNAFNGCASLENIDIPDGVQSVEAGLFDNCKSLKSITIPRSVTAIGDLAFSGCKLLSSIVIPDSVTTIGNRAFSGCKLLTIYCEAQSQPRGWKYNWNELNRPVVWACGKQAPAKNAKPTAAKSGSFPTLGNYDQSKFVIENGVLKEYTGRQQTVEIPQGVTSISAWAFNECYSVKNVVIPHSVTSIGDFAFNECTGLKGVVIPNSVVDIGNFAFNECTGLKSVVIPNSVTVVGDFAFDECAAVTIYCVARSKPRGWHSEWNSENRPVVWGYKGQ